jgi:hypothetical protein
MQKEQRNQVAIMGGLTIMLNNFFILFFILTRAIKREK